MVQSRIKALERLDELDAIEEDPEYVFRCGAAQVLNESYIPGVGAPCCGWPLRFGDVPARVLATSRLVWMIGEGTTRTATFP